MPHPFTAYRDENPAHVVEAAPLFQWAREQADAVAATKAKIEAERARLATVLETVESSGEFGDLEEARERARKAKVAAYDADPAYVKAALDVKAARAALKKVKAHAVAKDIKKGIKALVATVGETQDRLATALSDGKVPAVVEGVAAKTARQVDA